jgi:metallo-beta-lactamase class B
MKTSRIAALLLSATALIGAQALAQSTNGRPPPEPFVQNKESLADTAKADALMAKDHKNLDDIGMLCKPLPEIFAKGDTYEIPPASKVFDNLYYVGLGKVGAWAITTSDGIILIDTLDNTDEAKQYIEGGLKSLGLDPAQIKYIIVSHGHFDHFGGAKYLQDTYHPHILMSPADWDLMAKTPKMRNGMQMPDGPTHDMDVTDGQKLTLGDTTLTLYITPGHTPGTVSAVIPVKDHGKTHLVSFWGGTAFSSNLELLHKYQASVERFGPMATSQDVQGVISNHPVFDYSVKKIDEMKAHPGAKNPFLIGAKTVGLYYEVLDNCLKAQIARHTPASGQ